MTHEIAQRPQHHRQRIDIQARRTQDRLLVHRVHADTSQSPLPTFVFFLSFGAMS
jgi:hypothetical protein